METITLPAELDSLAKISEFISDGTTRAGLDDHAAWQVQLAVDEAATNIIQHSYDGMTPGSIVLTWRRDENEFIVTLLDHGHSFNPDEVPSPDVKSPLEERQAGGLGLFIMGQLMDTVNFTFDPNEGNLLTMTKLIDRSANAVRTFTLNGRLDAVHSSDMMRGVHVAIADGARRILLDMAAVTFLSSSGLRALLLTRKELLAQDGELRLCALRPEVEEVFALTGFTQVFSIHATREEALQAFKREHL
jgi:serine/threonine-protein kinase RsbW